MSPEEDRTRDAVDSEPKHYQLSYSGPLSGTLTFLYLLQPDPPLPLPLSLSFFHSFLTSLSKENLQKG